MEIAGARRAGNGASSEDESQPLSLWTGFCRSAVAYCRHLILSRARRATSCWERRWLRREGQGNAAPAGKLLDGAMSAVPMGAQAQERRETAAVTVKLSADRISGLGVSWLSSQGRRCRVPAEARQVAWQPPIPQPLCAAGLVMVGSFWKRGEE